MTVFPFLLAWRTLTIRQAAPIRLMTMLSWTSMFIASCAFSLILAIMHGFEQETYKKLQGVHDDITIRAHGKELDIPTITKILKKEFSHAIAATMPRATQYCLLLNESEQTQVVVATGIELNDQSDQKLITRLHASPAALQQLKQRGSFLIGSALADMLGLNGQRTFHLALPSEQFLSENKLYFDRIPATIAGHFTSGMEDFDLNVMFCSQETFHTLFGSGTNEIGLTLTNYINSDNVARDLRLRFGPSLDIVTWQELYPALIEALNLEKYAMFCVLSLVIVIACISLFSLLFMLINQKRVEIALMRAHGIPLKLVAKTYVILGCAVAISAAWCGTLGSIGISWLLNHYQLIRLPDMYGISWVPALISWYTTGAILLVVTALSFITCIAATRRIDALSIAAVLRFET